MKILVCEINKNNLQKYLQLFELTRQITVTDEKPVGCSPIIPTIEPYYIEENVKDLDGTIELLNNVYRSPSCRIIDWNDFSSFFQIILNIKKQRETGFAISDTEYVYRKLKEQNFPVQLKRAFEINGFDENYDNMVVTGKSEIGEIFVFQDDGFCEFVFILSYTKKSFFTKKEYQVFTHWHPSYFRTAITDAVAFFNNDRQYFKRVGLNLK